MEDRRNIDKLREFDRAGRDLYRWLYDNVDAMIEQQGGGGEKDMSDWTPFSELGTDTSVTDGCSVQVKFADGTTLWMVSDDNCLAYDGPLPPRAITHYRLPFRA
jgi:hypothetical protein